MGGYGGLPDTSLQVKATHPTQKGDHCRISSQGQSQPQQLSDLFFGDK